MHFITTLPPAAQGRCRLPTIGTSVPRVAAGTSIPVSTASSPQLSTVQIVVLDMQGTTSPISFITELLFPHARDNVHKDLYATYGSDETKDDIIMLRALATVAARGGGPGRRAAVLLLCHTRLYT
ncbi:unnamed protein product [Urochloa humidicola]